MRRSVWRGDLIRARGMGRRERSTKSAGYGGRRRRRQLLGVMLRLSIWRSMNRGERRADATSGDEELSPSRLSSVAHEIWKRIFSDRLQVNFTEKSTALWAFNKCTRKGKLWIFL